MTFPFAFLLQCKRISRRKGALVSFLLLPLLVLLTGVYLPGETAGDAVSAGVYLPVGAPGADELWQALDGHSDVRGYALSFVPAASPEHLADQVAAGVWECGYLFPSDFRQRLREENYSTLITRIDSPASSLGLLINEAVSAAILDLCAPDIAMAYMKQSGILSDRDEAGGRLAEDLIPQFFSQPIALKTTIEYINGPDGSSSSSSGSSGGGGAAGFAIPALFRGLVAVYLFLFSCLCSIWFIEDRRSGFYRRLSPYLKPGALYLPYFCAASLFAAAEGLLALLLAGFLFPGFTASFPTEVFTLLLYLAYLAVISYFLAGLFHRGETLAAALPFLLTACLLFCPILFDLRRYIPITGGLAALLPPTLYLRAASAIGAVDGFSRLPAVIRGFAGYLAAAAALYVTTRLRKST